VNAPLDLFARLPLLPSPDSVEADRALCAPLLEQLRAVVGIPGTQAHQHCEVAFDALGRLPLETASELRAECLFLIAQHHYMAANATAALAPTQAASAIARRRNDAALLRKALSFLGVTLADTGNLPEAIACYAEALAVATTLPDPGAAAPVWNNLGLALRTAARYQEAIDCFERAAALAVGSETYGMVGRSAHSNIASCALAMRRPDLGLPAARRAIALNLEPATPAEYLSRAIAESNYVRLLLELGELDPAIERCRIAAEYAARLPASRAGFVVAMSQGLIDIRSGAVQSGVDHLKSALEKARTQLHSELRDALAVCVTGYEAAGQPDVALVYLHEILALNKAAAENYIELHHLPHVATLEQRAATASEVAAPLARQRGALRERLDERELLRNRILLLEQQSVAAELHDDATGEHCYRVGRLASLLAREIGLEDEVCFLIDLAARLHDIGKLVVPDAILLKPGALTAGERQIMQTHTVAGAEILARSKVPQMHVAEEIALYHHERWDGSGYPLRVAGRAIPIAARVTALADVFDALTHVRPYKAAWPVADALAEIARLRGTHFDPELTDVFLRLVPRLQREVGDLDAHLAVDAQHSRFIRARREIASALKGDDPSVSRFELSR
jgi:putative two-component system response regulator